MMLVDSAAGPGRATATAESMEMMVMENCILIDWIVKSDQHFENLYKIV